MAQAKKRYRFNFKIFEQIKMTKIAIVGSRDYPNMDMVTRYLDSLKGLLKNISLITGGARGVDRTAERWALENKIECQVIRPVDPNDKISYLFRNIEKIKSTLLHELLHWIDDVTNMQKSGHDYYWRRRLDHFCKVMRWKGIVSY